MVYSESSKGGDEDEVEMFMRLWFKWIDDVGLVGQGLLGTSAGVTDGFCNGSLRLLWE